MLLDDNDPNKKKYICDICGLALANSQSYNKHKRNHGEHLPN